MRRFRTIILTPSEPLDHLVLWYHEGKLLHFENGAWIPLLSTDTLCSDVSNLLGVVNVTYAELLNLRNQGKLVGGVLYRITDYITTVGNDHEVESAGHPFDIIVLALDLHTLSEHAYAANSSRDTNGHFAKSKLSAWLVWYCLDNDVTRFQWADTTNGKGVIYRLIDEWNNDCPYDFKNILFARYPTLGEFWDNHVALNSDEIKFPSYVLGRNMFFNGLEIEDERYVDYFYTFTNYLDSHIDDASLLYKVADDIQNCYSLACSNNKIEPYLIALVIDGTTYQTMALNNIVLIAFDNDNGNSVQLYGNYWNTGCYNMTFQDKCYGNTFGTNCSCWVAFTFLYNTIGSNCSQNLFGFLTVNNSFGSHFCTNTFGGGCVLSTFGNECLYNTFEGKCSRSSFGNACSGNTFDSTAIASDGLSCCEANTFGNLCEQNTFNCFIHGCTIGNKVSFLSILCDPSETGPGLIHILDGTQGTDSDTLVVEIPYSTTQVCRYIGKNSKGELKIWTPADNIS